MVNLTTLVGAPGQIGDPQGVGTITDDDPPPTLSVNDVSVTEGNAGTTTATFTVSLSATSGNAVTFDWATAPGTAAAGVDYVTRQRQPHDRRRRHQRHDRRERERRCPG